MDSVRDFEVLMARSHLNGLADCVIAGVLKEGCENREGRNSRVKSLRELQKVHRWEYFYNILNNF